MVEHQLPKLTMHPIARKQTFKKCKPTASYGCEFNRWLQHLSSNTRAGGVVNEAETETVFYRA